MWSDAHNFPNLPLMKISAYHKSLGDHVEMLNHLNHYDRVYASKTFSWTNDIDDLCMVYADEIVKGGTGYAIKLVNGKEVFSEDKNLPKEIEHIYPDYSLYPQYDFAVGFLTRGCPMGCGFCVVGKKEGLCSRRVADLREWWGGQKKIKLLDPNLLACAEHEDILQELIKSKAKLDITQGFDIRLVTTDNIKLINQLNIKMIHFAWDNPKIDLTEKLRFFAEHGKIKNYSQRTVYILTNYNSTEEEDLYRIMTCFRLGFTPYQMIYDKQHAPRTVRKMQRWCNSQAIFKSCSWEKYQKGAK